MGTTTAMLHYGQGHPYDDGLWGDFKTLQLIEGNRCVWYQKTPVERWLAHPKRILKDGLRALQETHWTEFPETDPWTPEEYQRHYQSGRVILCIFRGSSLNPETCARIFQSFGMDAEVLSGKTESAGKTRLREICLK
ncbi:hypothetical protein ACJU26_09380 [Acidithiobacillus sp. M4-SHS-6]|uniref:hypothetical protein n=1 Tax=Acidithiobacillus sp. M4-SHS-6 TaxID=3383024 RepID=UPI0039BE01CE